VAGENSRNAILPTDCTTYIAMCTEEVQSPPVNKENHEQWYDGAVMNQK
jgi:hypothetical protein